MKKLFLALIFIFGFVGWAFAADVTLQWDANTEPDLAGYYVYQSDRIGDKTTAWVKITQDMITVVTFTVTGLDSSNYAWMVTAVDTQGNESFVSNMVDRYDKIPPFAPSGLRVSLE